MRCIIVLLALSSASSFRADRTTLPFDSQWQFAKGDPSQAESPTFDDSQWSPVDLPHDWSIEGPFDPKAPAGGAGAFLPTGIGWYRKHFTLPSDTTAQLTFIDFDGVMANSDVWINGFHLGHRPYGYSSFEYQLTGHLHFGSQDNVIAVRADNSKQPASRWYAGAGIYRHVRLTRTNPVHFKNGTTFITTPKVAPDQATVHIQNTVVNESDEPVAVGIDVFISSASIAFADKRKVIPPHDSADFQNDITLPHPQLWDVEHPNLYHWKCVAALTSGDAVDQDETTFGIRKIDFKPDTGFWLNDVHLKIKGVCLHGDMGGLGVAVPLGVWERRLAALKRIGCNAIRTAHNPPPPNS